MRNKSTVLVLILCLRLIRQTESAEGPLPLDVSFPSPNGRYVVHLEELNGAPHFVITKKGTEQIDNSIVMPTRLLYLRWAADSKAFVTVEHIAKGSYGRIIRLEGDKWRNVEVNPPSKRKNYHRITRLQLRTHDVHYQFGVTLLTENWRVIGYRICDFDVSLKTGKRLNVSCLPATDLTPFGNLLQNPVYLPPMDYKGPRER